MSNIITVKTVTEANEFLGLGKPKHPLVSVIHHDHENFRREYQKGRYVIDLFQISLKDGFSGSIGYGRNSYDFQEGTIILTAPGQVITMNETVITNETGGWSLYFHPDLIRKSDLGGKMNTYPFFSYEANEALHLSKDEIETLNDIIYKIEKEISQNIDKHSQNLVISNIELLLNYSRRFYDRQFYTRSNMNKDIVTQFERLLTEYYHSKLQFKWGVPSVKYCAEQLNHSPNYLSDLLKKETGRNATDHIHFFIIEKAKNILLGSEETISEIAYDLGFEYPQSFGKLFKNKTGMSPNEYRNLN
jgi:AraC-like DNA-binding protein